MGHGRAAQPFLLLCRQPIRVGAPTYKGLSVPVVVVLSGPALGNLLDSTTRREMRQFPRWVYRVVRQCAMRKVLPEGGGGGYHLITAS